MKPHVPKYYKSILDKFTVNSKEEYNTEQSDFQFLREKTTDRDGKNKIKMQLTAFIAFKELNRLQEALFGSFESWILVLFLADSDCSVGSETKPLGTSVNYRYNTIVLTAMEIKCDGNVTSWEFYARDKGVFYASVWREEGIGHYVLVGKNLVNLTDIGRQVCCKLLLPPASEGWGRLYFHFVCQSTPRWGGVPGPGRGGTRSSHGWGGSQVQVGEGYLIQPWMGGSQSQIFRGVPVSDF